MARMLRRYGVAGLLGLAVAQSAQPAVAFDLFGIHLWGEREDETGRIEIADPLPYTVEIASDGEAESIVEGASSLWSDRETPAAGKAGLLSKGRGDYRRILAALYNEGYFGAGVSIRVDGREVSELNLSSDIRDNARVEISVERGERFKFGRTQIVNAPPLTIDDNDAFEPPSSVGFERGEDARTAAISEASTLAVTQWRQLSRAKAREADREMIANHPRNALDVTVTLDPGPPVKYGPVTARGSKRVDLDFVEYMTDLPYGGDYDPDEIDAARSRLSLLGTFDSIRLRESDALGPDGLMPISVVVEDRKPRTIGFGGTYSTLDGLGLNAYWMHRNLFGRAERLRFDASIEGLLTAGSFDEYDYNLGGTFTKPGVLTPDTSFIGSLVASQLDYETYRQRSLTGQAGFTHQFTPNLSGELYGQISRARYEDDFGTRNFMTYGLIGRGSYDRRDDEFDATRGYYLAAELLPYYEAKYGNFAARGTVEARVFHGFGEEKDVVVAARGKVGSFVGSSVEESPPDMLFFAGGGGSVRGYEYRSIGVEGESDGGDDTVSGGKSLAEASLELRYRFAGNFGAVGFVDAGLVNSSSNFTEDGDFLLGAGIGARYYTSFGPLRLDVAVPLDKREDDDAFGVYIGIGQAF
jgi:translocation and assembly module TamA